MSGKEGRWSLARKYPATSLDTKPNQSPAIQNLWFGGGKLNQTRDDRYTQPEREQHRYGKIQHGVVQ